MQDDKNLSDKMNINSQYPVVLLPIRLETRFANIEIIKPMEPGIGGIWNWLYENNWDGVLSISPFISSFKKGLDVRIFPDIVAVDIHEPELTEREIEWGKNFWKHTWLAGEDEEQKKLAWAQLAERFRPERAAWIALQLKPLDDKPAKPPLFLSDTGKTGLTKDEIESGKNYWKLTWLAGENKEEEERARAQFAGNFGSEKAESIIKTLEPLNIQDKPARAPQFPSPPKRGDDLISRARIKVLPDHWVAFGYIRKDGIPTRFGPFHGKPIPDLLDIELSSELLTDGKSEWMHKFDVAVEKGMALRIPFKPGQETGFDRLIVLGVKQSSSEEESAKMLESLLDAHHYTNGLGFVLHGTPSNNTADALSGYSSSDPDYQRSYQVERLGDPIQGKSGLNGSDTAKFFGIDSSVFEHVQYSEYPNSGNTGNPVEKQTRSDHDARNMNTALWSATWSYFLDQMAAGSFQDVNPDYMRQGRRHFIDYVRACGPLPAIRISNQPYGLLPVTSLDRWTSNDGSAVDIHLVNFLRSIRKFWLDSISRSPHIRTKIDIDKDIAIDNEIVSILGMDAISRSYAGRWVLGPDYTQFLEQNVKQTMDSTSWYGVGEISGISIDQSRLGKCLFSEEHFLLAGPRIKTGSLSETEGLNLDSNYIQQLLNASYEDLQNDESFSGKWSKFLFKWGDEGAIKDFLVKDFNLGWVKDAGVRYRLDYKAIFISKGDNRLGLHRNDDRERVNLSIDDGRIGEFILKKENGELKVYSNPYTLLYMLLRHAALLEYGSAAQRILGKDWVESELVDDNTLTIWKMLESAGYVFSWEDISDTARLPGKENYKLINYLRRRFELDWLDPRYAIIRKIDEGNTIKIKGPFVWPPDQQNYILIMLNPAKTKANLTISTDKRKDKFVAKSRKSKLMMYSADDDLDTIKEELRNQNYELPKQPQEKEEFIEFWQSLHYLANRQTAVLDRFMSETLDLCSYRLDAWITSLATKRLELMRQDKPRGLYIGGYGWLEQEHQRTQPGEEELLHRSEFNAGFVHAPSLNHAATAAILRSGYLSHGISGSFPFAVDLSSERVHRALWLLEGVRQGQPPGALLGYRFERGLHDEGLDQYVSPFRKLAPLNADGLNVPIEVVEAIAANNVVDGLALHRRWKKGKEINQWNSETIPFGENDFPKKDEFDLIMNKLNALDDDIDAVNDILVSESVFQMVRGNHSRVAATLDALSHGDTLPQELEIIRTPRSGIGITHRILVLFSGDIDEDDKFIKAWPINGLQERAQAEPHLNAWVARLLGDPHKIRCRIEYLDPKTKKVLKSYYLSLSKLELSPLDAIYMAEGNAVAQRSELEQRLSYYIIQNHKDKPPDADANLFFARDPKWSPKYVSFAEFLEVAHTIRKLIASARAIDDRDLSLPEDAAKASSERGDADELNGRIDKAVEALNQTLRSLGYLFSWDDIPKNNIENERLIKFLQQDYGVDWIRIDLIQKSADGTITISEGNNSLSLELNKEKTGVTLKINDTIKEFTAKIENGKVNVYNFHDLEKIREGLLHASHFGVQGAVPIASPDEKILFLQVESTVKEIKSRLDKVQSSSDPHDVFGADFLVLPRFTPKNIETLEKAFKASTSLQGNDPNAVVTWFQRIARVRPGVARLDDALMYAGALKSGDKFNFKVAQLPYREIDRWAGLSKTSVDGGRLSLIAHVPLHDGDKRSVIDSNEYVAGLMIDDFTEIIPSEKEITGLTFHFDEPDAEPPQAILLAVPPDVKKGWDIDTLEAIVSETLDLAQMRAVDPQDLVGIGHYLSALYFAINRADETVSTDFTKIAGIPPEGE